jgi:hypothetical protein
MSASFENQQVVNTFNLFIDSERASIVGDANSKGDELTIQFEGSTIIAGDGELIRLTLTNFDMFNNFNQVDRNNSEFSIKINALSSTAPRLPHKNYGTPADIVYEFGRLVAEAIFSAQVVAVTQVQIVNILNVVEDYGTTKVFPTGYSAAGASAVTFLPVALNKIPLGGTSNKLLDITFECRSAPTTPIAHGLTALKITTRQDKGDTYCILGAERFDDPYADAQLTQSGSSLKVTLSGSGLTTGQFRVQGYFPIQRMTEPFVYLRCNLSQTGGLETAGLSTDQITKTTNNSDITVSNILAKFRRDTEFISYTSAGDNEFFINLQQRKLSSMKLTLTDSKGRQIGQATNGGTSAGLETALDTFASSKQDTLGNLNFSATIRVDIIHMNTVSKLESAPLPLAFPARKAQQQVLTFQNFGMPKNGV